MDFSFMLNSVGRKVNVERGGPEELSGKLVAIISDFLIVQTEKDGLVYVSTQHITAMSESVIPESQLTPTEVRGVPNETQTLAPTEAPALPIIEATSFSDLLTKLTNRLVRINHGGPNSIVGVVTEVRPDSITVLHNMHDLVHFPIVHIRSVTWIGHTSDDANEKADRSTSDDANGKADRSTSDGDAEGHSNLTHERPSQADSSDQHSTTVSVINAAGDSRSESELDEIVVRRVNKASSSNSSPWHPGKQRAAKSSQSKMVNRQYSQPTKARGGGGRQLQRERPLMLTGRPD